MGKQDKIKTNPTVKLRYLPASTTLFMDLGKLINPGTNAAKASNSGAANSLGFCFGICHLANVDPIFGVLDVIHFVHIGRGYGEGGAVVAEGQGRYAGGVAMELTQPLFIERIPNIHKSIGTA